ncbi:MAG: oligosaccharide flippase family protein [Planctomycetota bacterium]|jgi:O-antigen/teichoic acid export membrane protein
MLAQACGAALVNLGGFIALGWLLFEKDFGLYALTTTIAMAAALIQRIGIDTILVRRYRKFATWANPALWMSLGIGLTSAALMAAAAPVGERLYGEEGLAGLVLVVATSMPLIAVCAVPEARLQAQLRFRLLAAIRFGLLAGIMLLTIVFALLDFEAYSFVIPRPIMQAVRLVVVWWVAKPPIRWRLQVRRWRYMLTDAAMLAIFNTSNYVTNHCDVMVLGLFHTDKIVGLYYYAIRLSQRAVVMLTLNLRDVLFPALSSIQDDPARQVAGFLRASRLLALVGVPACLGLAALAEPGFHAVLPERWADSIPLLQVLSLGATFRLLGLPAFALIRAQGRFRTLMVVSVATSAVFLATVAVAAMIGESLSVAVGVALFMVVSGPVHMYIAVRSGGGRWRQLWTVFAAPGWIGVTAVGAAWLAGNQLPEMPHRDWALLVLIPLLSAAVYVPLIRWAAPVDFGDLQERLLSLLQRRR